MKTNVFGIDGGRSILVFFYFEHVAIFFCSRDPPPFTFVLERLLFLVKIAETANRVFYKTFSRSIYTSAIINGGGQVVLKRKKY